MRRFLIVMLALAFVGVLNSNAEAGRRGRVFAQRRARAFRPMQRGVFQNRWMVRSRPSVFDGLMNFERRKNAWLRSTFLRR